MALDTTIQQVLAANMLDEITALLDAETLGALIEVRVGAPTATTEEADTGLLLANLVCTTPNPFPAATPAATATMLAAAITSDVSASDTGQAGHFTAGSSATTDVMTSKVISGTAGVGASFDLNFDDDMIVKGGTVAVTAWTINMPTN